MGFFIIFKIRNKMCKNCKCCGNLYPNKEYNYNCDCKGIIFPTCQDCHNKGKWEKLSIENYK